MMLRGILLLLCSSLQVFALDTVQRGERVFTSYCAGCHTLRYTSSLLQKNSLLDEDARQWFGRMPPDLSLIARERGARWLYDYLTGFYEDKTRPFGTNNHVVPDVGMPNVLASLDKGTLKQVAHDVVGFLVEVAEPHRSLRYRIGFFVMVFLAVFGLLIYRLKTLCWRDLNGKI